MTRLLSDDLGNEDRNGLKSTLECSGYTLASPVTTRQRVESLPTGLAERQMAQLFHFSRQGFHSARGDPSILIGRVALGKRY